MKKWTFIRLELFCGSKPFFEEINASAYFSRLVTRQEPYNGLFHNFDGGWLICFLQTKSNSCSAELMDGVGMEKIRPKIPQDIHPPLRVSQSMPIVLLKISTNLA